jgi:hypothetical protein
MGLEYKIGEIYKKVDKPKEHLIYTGCNHSHHIFRSHEEGSMYHLPKSLRNVWLYKSLERIS